MGETQDLSGFTIAEPGESDITLTEDRCTWASFESRGEDGDVYATQDYGANTFKDLFHQFTVNFTSQFAFSRVEVWAITDTAAEDFRTFANAIGVGWYTGSDANQLAPRIESDLTANTNDQGTAVATTFTRYLTVIRRGGIATLKVFSNSSRTTLIDTLSITVSSQPYQYFYCVVNHNTSSADRQSNGFSELFEFFPIDFDEGFVSMMA